MGLASNGRCLRQTHCKIANLINVSNCRATNRTAHKKRTIGISYIPQKISVHKIYDVKRREERKGKNAECRITGDSKNTVGKKEGGAIATNEARFSSY